MNLVILFLALFEVATFRSNPVSKELFIDFTDDQVFQNADKQFMAHPCRLRTSTNLVVNMRETSIPQSCRAELIKFLLNAGYKPVDARTFTK